MNAVSQTGSLLSVPPVLLPQPPETNLTHGHEAPLPARSPRPAALGATSRLVPGGLFSRDKRYKNLTSRSTGPAGMRLIARVRRWRRAG
jgi:hypothetical protein